MNSQVRDVPEDSEQIVQMRNRRNTLRKTRVEGAEALERPKLTEPLSYYSAHLNEKVAGTTPRKRGRDNSDKTEKSEGWSESITTGGRRRRRQTVPPTPRTPLENRYNLRRHKISSTNTATQPSVEINKKKDKTADNGEHGAIEQVTNPEVSSLGGASKNVNTAPLVQVTTSKTVEEVCEFSSHRVVKVWTRSRE